MLAIIYKGDKRSDLQFAIWCTQLVVCWRLCLWKSWTIPITIARLPAFYYNYLRWPCYCHFLCCLLQLCVLVYTVKFFLYLFVGLLYTCPLCASTSCGECEISYDECTVCMCIGFALYLIVVTCTTQSEIL